MDKNDRVYCHGEDVFFINNSASLVIKSFWDDDDLCADGFIKYTDGTTITFGCTEMTSPKELFVPTYFELSENFVAICFLTGNRIDVERIFDVLARSECSLGTKAYEVAVKQFKKELFVKQWCELGEVDQNQIRKHYGQISNDENVLSSFAQSVQKQIYDIRSSKGLDFQERVRNLEVFSLSLATVQAMDSMEASSLIETFLNKPKQKKKIVSSKFNKYE